ncbi:HNH endonuclease [Galactobacter valiniphilus]|uniref:HNH endonuclease n=1 Tax=Galactobacter valiniphilus TaxID=2676122 RepID=A0A399J680_9MICC|nr:HNH endonuclease [Galactobacter valiniphilus]RII40973.1 HNH endonuclease [Galactobacter valiniphilus]
MSGWTIYCQTCRPTGIQCGDCAERQQARRRPRAYWKARGRVLKAAREAGASCALAYDDVCTGTPTEADHIIPVSEGGSHDEANLQATCQACNAHKNLLSRRTSHPRQATRPQPRHPGLRDTPDTDTVLRSHGIDPEALSAKERAAALAALG